MVRENLKKIDLVKQLNNRTGLSKNLLKKIVDDLIYIIGENIKTNNFNIKNIGSFKILDKKKRIGRNPKTKKEYLITARKRIKFVVSKKISKFYE